MGTLSYALLMTSLEPTGIIYECIVLKLPICTARSNIMLRGLGFMHECTVNRAILHKDQEPAFIETVRLQVHFFIIH